MAIKKSEIYSQIWAACDKLRGGVEPARYKDYILTLLFVKYVSDRFKSSDNWDIEVPEGGSFDDIAALKYKKNIDAEICPGFRQEQGPVLYTERSLSDYGKGDWY